MRPAFAVLLLSALTFAQTAAKPATGQSKPATPPAASSQSAEVTPPEDSPNAPAVTIAGFCPGKQETGAACKTEISKADFEKLAKALGVPDSRKRELAMAYAQFLVLSTLADERGLDKRSDIEDILKFVRMQTLSQLYTRDLREEAAKTSQADIDAYYKEHASQFNQATLERVFIPKMPPNPQEKLDEAAIKAEGDKILAEAKKPDANFAALQKQAYADLKISATAPPTDLKDTRREGLPETQGKAFELAPGEVTEIDDQGGIYIYKMVSKSSKTEAEAEPEIKRALEAQRYSQEMSKATANIKPELNEAYFGPTPGPPMPPSLQPGPAPKPAVTPHGPPASKVPAGPSKSPTATSPPK